MQLSQEQFFKRYNIDRTLFESTNINWNNLLEIYNDYSTYKETLKPTADYISNLLRTHPDAHTVRSRIKDPEHLIDKIIRKIIRNKDTDPNYNIDINNYKTEITDLIGIRVLHLYKDQAVNIDRFIRENWNLEEKCTIYYREGDYSKPEEHEDSEHFEFKVHEAGYRSWHYLISSQGTKNAHIAEIQVRTIFEEGWSEIDHQLRYPNHIDNMLLTKQLLVLNRVAGSADELANSIRETKVNLTSLVSENQKNNKLIEELKTQLNSLLSDYKVEKADKEKLQAKVNELESSLTVTLPRDGLFKSYSFNGEIEIPGTSSVGSGIDSWIKSGNLVIQTEDNNLFDTKKYLSGYTHPAIKKNDE